MLLPALLYQTNYQCWSRRFPKQAGITGKGVTIACSIQTLQTRARTRRSLAAAST